MEWLNFSSIMVALLGVGVALWFGIRAHRRIDALGDRLSGQSRSLSELWAANAEVRKALRGPQPSPAEVMAPFKVGPRDEEFIDGLRAAGFGVWADELEATEARKEGFV